MTATGAPEAVGFTVSSDFGSGAIPTSGAGVTALERHQLMPDAYHGKTVGYRIDHATQVKYQVGFGVYDSGTDTISRPAGAGSILLSSAGAGINETFPSGMKRVLIVPTGADFESIILFRGGGRTINEATDFAAGLTFTVDLADTAHRSLKVMGVSDGALTQPMTVALPDPDTAQWGDEIYVGKGDTSTHTVTVSGFDNNEIGTHVLRRQDQFIVAKLVGPTEKRWERTRGGQQNPSAFGQDLIKASAADAANSLLGTAAVLQQVTAAQAIAGIVLTRTTQRLLVELTQDMDTNGTFALPTSSLVIGDSVRLVRHGGGLGLWLRTGTGSDSSDVLRGRDDLIDYQWSGSAWVRALLREQQVLRINQATYTVSGGDHLLDLVFHTTPCTVTLPHDMGTRTRFRLVQEGSAVVTIAQPFAGVAANTLTTPTASPPLATAGDGTALAVTVIGNATGTAARYRLVLEHPVPQGGAILDGGIFSPAAVDLSGDKEYDPITQSGDWAFALAAVTEVPGALVSVEVTGTADIGNTITWSADFEEINGGLLTDGDYAGFTGPRRLMISWSATQGKALVALGGAIGGGGGTWGSIGGTLANQLDLNAALDAKAAVAPVRSTQTAASVTLETVLAAGAAVNRHNTIVELAGDLDQEVDLAGLSADSIVLLTDNQSLAYVAAPIQDVVTYQRVLKGSDEMYVVGPAEAVWNPKHDRAYLAPAGTVHVEHKHSSPAITRVSGPVAQLPLVAVDAFDPVILSAGTVDFDTLAVPTKLTLTGTTPNKISQWTDTLGILTTPLVQGNAVNQPHILGTSGEKDYKAYFNAEAIGAAISMANGDCPDLTNDGFTIYFVGSHTKRPSGTGGFHSFGSAVDHTLQLALDTGTWAYIRLDSDKEAAGGRGMLNDFAWRDGGKFVYAASFQAGVVDAVVPVFAWGFHERRGAEVTTTGANATWKATTIQANSVRLGSTVSQNDFGFLQQIGVIPLPVDEATLAKIVKFLRLKWMD